jgi:hypothetical protein
MFGNETNFRPRVQGWEVVVARSLAGTGKSFRPEQTRRGIRFPFATPAVVKRGAAENNDTPRERMHEDSILRDAQKIRVG